MKLTAAQVEVLRNSTGAERLHGLKIEITIRGPKRTVDSLIRRGLAKSHAEGMSWGNLTAELTPAGIRAARSRLVGRTDLNVIRLASDFVEGEHVELAEPGYATSKGIVVASGENWVSVILDDYPGDQMYFGSDAPGFVSGGLDYLFPQKG